MKLLQNRREQWMAGVLGSLLGLFVLYEFANRVVFAPLDGRRREISAARRRVQDLDLQVALIQRSLRSIAEDAQHGLARDAVTATLDYQGWLLDTSRRVQFQNVQITPGTPLPEEHVGHRLPFTVVCQGSFLSLVQFLECVQQVSLLHRVSNVSVTPSAQDGGPLEISVMIEALSLEQSEEQSSGIKSAVQRPDARLTTLKQLVSANNLFSRPRKTPSTSTAPSQNVAVNPAPQETAAAVVVTLIACGMINRRQEAWFHTTGQEEPVRIRVGDDLVITNRKLRVSAIHGDAVVLTDGGIEHRMELGDALPNRLLPGPATPTDAENRLAPATSVLSGA
jgi:hypothetical protein